MKTIEIEISIDTVNALQHYLFFQKICYSKCEKVFSVIHDKISHFTDKKLNETASYYEFLKETPLCVKPFPKSIRLLNIVFDKDEIMRICNEIRRIDTIIKTCNYQDSEEFYLEYKDMYYDIEHKDLSTIFFKAERKLKLTKINEKLELADSYCQLWQ